MGFHHGRYAALAALALFFASFAASAQAFERPEEQQALVQALTQAESAEYEDLCKKLIAEFSRVMLTRPMSSWEVCLQNPVTRG